MKTRRHLVVQACALGSMLTALAISAQSRADGKAFFKRLAKVGQLAERIAKKSDGLPFGTVWEKGNGVSIQPRLLIERSASWARNMVDRGKTTYEVGELADDQGNRESVSGGQYSTPNGVVSMVGRVHTSTKLGRKQFKRPVQRWGELELERPGYRRSVGISTDPFPNQDGTLTQTVGVREAVQLPDDAALALGVPKGQWLIRSAVYSSRTIDGDSGRFAPSSSRVTYYVPGVKSPTQSVLVLDQQSQIAVADRAFKEQKRRVLSSRSK